MFPCGSVPGRGEECSLYAPSGQGRGGSPRLVGPYANAPERHILDSIIVMKGVPMTRSLGDLERLVLLTLVRLGEGTYGAAIQRELKARTGRKVTPGTVYPTLDRLEQKGLVRSWMGKPTAERGGRAKRHYALLPEGLAHGRIVLERGGQFGGRYGGASQGRARVTAPGEGDGPDGRNRVPRWLARWVPARHREEWIGDLMEELGDGDRRVGPSRRIRLYGRVMRSVVEARWVERKLRRSEDGGGRRSGGLAEGSGPGAPHPEAASGIHDRGPGDAHPRRLGLPRGIRRGGWDPLRVPRLSGGGSAGHHRRDHGVPATASRFPTTSTSSKGPICSRWPDSGRGGASCSGPKTGHGRPW